MALYLRDATFLDWRTLEVRRCHLRVEAGSAPEAVEAVPPSGKRDPVLDCGGRLVTRSLACGHHHVYSALSLGMPPPAASPVGLREILERVWWRLDRCLDRDMVEASALATAVDAARCGAAFVIDHHSSPNSIEGSLETIAAAFARVGIACLPCYEMSDRDGQEARARGLEETRSRLAAGRPCLVGLHASFTVGDRLLRDAVDLARRFDSGIHIHAAEDPVDQEETAARYGCRVVERLARAGVLESGKAILAHCLHLSERERELIAASRAWVVHSVESNLNNAVGLPSRRGLGDRVMLGTDGMHSDMLRAAQARYFVSGGAERGTPEEAYHGLRAVHRYLADGAFAGDGEDNLVILDYPTRTELTRANAASHFVYGLRSSHVHSLVAAGRLVLKARELTLVDESEIHAEARSQARRLWKMLERGS